MGKTIELTDEQASVINSQCGIKRVIACAGSGKTWVITKSIIDTINRGKCSPSRILALTFTRNAAENMRTRIRDNTESADFDDINIYTFNSFGNEIVKENSFQFTLGRDFRVLTSAETWQLIYQIFKQHEFEYLDIKKSPGKAVQDIMSYIDSLKNNLITPDELKHYTENNSSFIKDYKSSALLREEKEAVKVQKDLAFIYSKYEQLKKDNNCIDYQDQVYLPYFLFKENKSIREKYKKRYSYIFIDEFQDTNIAQAYFLAMLNGPDNKMTVVGDDDQGIYSFRGACVENILNFHLWDLFKQCRVKDFYLTVNFRSGQNIISALNKVIAANETRFEKQLKPAEDAGQSEVGFFYQESHQQEASTMASLISRLNQQGVRLKDMAILNRRKQFDTIIRQLEKMDIRYEIIGSKSFYFEKEILFLLSWVRLVYDVFDQVSLLYILKSDKYKLGDRDIFFLKREPDQGRTVSLLAGVQNSSENTHVSNQAKSRLAGFLQELNFYLQKSSLLKLKELVSLIYQHSGLQNHLKSNFGSSYKKKINNVETLIKIASDFEDDFSGNNLSAFNTYLSQVAKTDYEGPDSIEFGSEDSVKIMSIHAAKGLEFEVVFLPMLWANDYKQKSSNSKFVLPSSLRKDSRIWQKKGKFGSQAKFKQELKKIREEEERRIFYVACSRAKKLLVLSHSQYRDRYDMENEKSKKKIVPFFKDLSDFGNLKVLNQAGSDYLQDLIPGQAFKVEDSGIFKFLAGKKKISYPQIDFKKANQYIMTRAGKNKKTEVHPPEGKIRTKKKTINQNVFSLTSILDYLKCPAMYRYKYVMSLPEPLNKSIKTGQKVHKLLEKAALAKLSLPKIGQQELIKLTTDKDIQNYLGFYARSPFFNVDQVERVWLEQLIYLKLSENIVTSKVDRLDKLDGENYRIIDYKVAECRNSKMNISYMRQLAAYALACSEIWSVSIDRIECFLFFLKNNHKQSICFTPGHIKEIKQSFLEAISGIKSGNFSANKTQACSYCSYSRFCGL